MSVKTDASFVFVAKVNLQDSRDLCARMAEINLSRVCCRFYRDWSWHV